MISTANGDPGDDDDPVDVDYKRSPLSLTIPPNTTSSLVEIQIEDDQFLESNEFFRIVITPENRNTFQVDIIIRDDDDVRVNITARRSSVTAGSPAIFTITRTEPQVDSNRRSPADDLVIPVSISTTFTMTLEAIEINDEGINYAPSISTTTSALEPSADRTTVSITIPAGTTATNYIIPTVDDGVSKSRSELKVRIRDGTLTSEKAINQNFRAILGDSSEASLLVLSPRALYIRLKVFLEGPLQ